MGGVNCNFYVEGLEVEDIDGFFEVEKGHYISKNDGAKIRFRIKDLSNIKINALVLEPLGSKLEIRGWYNKDISLYSEITRHEYINLSNGKNKLQGIISFIISILFFAVVQFLKKFRKKEDLVLWAMFAVMGLIFLGYNFQLTYASDDIPNFLFNKWGMEEDLREVSFMTLAQTLGRPGAGILFLIFGEFFYICSGSYQAIFNQQVLTVLVIALFAFCACIMYKVVDCILEDSTVKGKIINIITCCCFLYNPFFSDLMTFKGANLFYSFSILFNLVAAEIFIKNKGDVFNRKGLYIFLWIMVGAITYQPMGAYFVIFSLLGVSVWQIRDIDNIKNSMQKVICVGGIYGISYLLELIYIRCVGNTHTNYLPTIGMNILKVNFLKVWAWLGKFWITGGGYMHSNYFFFMVLLGFIILLLSCIFGGKKKIKNISISISFLAISYMIVFYFNLFEKAFWSITARTCTAFGGLPALEIILIAIVCENMQEKKTCKKMLTFVIICGIALCTRYYMDVVENANKISITCAEDAFLGQFYANRIKQYENETGEVISKIGFTEDISVTPYYIFGLEQANTDPFWRSTYISWSRNGLVEIFLDYRNLEVIDVPNKVYNMHFEGKNWDTLSEEQIIFEGDAVYICIY